MTVHHLPLLLLAALLLVAVATDLRARVIGNGVNLAVAFTAPLWWWAAGLGPVAIAWHVGLAVVLFLLFAGLFALGAMGGGDVKLVGAVALWLPPAALPAMLWWMALGGGALTLATLLWHRLGRRAGAVEVPYGVAIAGATIAAMANHILTNPVA